MTWLYFHQGEIFLLLLLIAIVIAVFKIFKPFKCIIERYERKNRREEMKFEEMLAKIGPTRDLFYTQEEIEAGWKRNIKDFDAMIKVIIVFACIVMFMSWNLENFVSVTAYGMITSYVLALLTKIEPIKLRKKD